MFPCVSVYASVYRYLNLLNYFMGKQKGTDWSRANELERANLYQ